VHSRYDTDNDLEDLRDSIGQDREISLGTTTIIGIFFALALLCAVFFGFGYSLGRRSAQTSAPSTAQTASSTADTDSSKPAPGSPLNHPSAAPPSRPVDNASSEAAYPTQADPAQDTPAPASVKTVVSTSESDERTSPPAKTTAAGPVALTPAAVTTTSPGAAVVQVAAVSHQEDADILATALKKRGYTVAVRQLPQDKLLHIQIGPFATKKEADAMRQRLQADGYNAIVK
jgi:cell division septation protein DedD